MCDIMRSLQDFNSVVLWIIHQRIVVDGIFFPLLVNGDTYNYSTGTGYFMVIINGSQLFDCPTAVHTLAFSSALFAQRSMLHHFRWCGLHQPQVSDHYFQDCIKDINWQGYWGCFNQILSKSINRAYYSLS